jgi:hypothetical protein
MTIIDTTLYANGALRLSRHGAGKGDTVLTHVASGRQSRIVDEDTDTVVQYLVFHADSSLDKETLFEDIDRRFGG